MEMTVTILTPPTGGAKIKIKFKSDSEILMRKKRCLIDPGQCKDFLCLPKYLILGKLFVEKNVNAINRLLYTIKINYMSKQKHYAKKLK